jgi:hypothetical protein
LASEVWVQPFEAALIGIPVSLSAIAQIGRGAAPPWPVVSPGKTSARRRLAISEAPEDIDLQDFIMNQLK